MQVTALPGVPLVQPGDDLVGLIGEAVNRAGLVLEDNDLLVISSKIVSKSEGRIVRLDSVEPSAEAKAVAAETRKDARVVEWVLRESRRISRKGPHVLVTEHRLGFVSANSGIDQSNLEDGDSALLLLPLDPDATALRIRQRLQDELSAEVAIVISDTHGRPFRLGNVGVAIGVAGMQALTDLRGQQDLYGRELHITMQGYADLVASAAHLLCGEAAEGLPLVLIRGLNYPKGAGRASDLYRPSDQDLYR